MVHVKEYTSQPVILWTFILVLVQSVQTAMELPKFSQLKLLYPGYYLHGGRYRDKDVMDLIGGNVHGLRTHNTASLRMSWALNQFGGRHSIGQEPIFLSKRGRDSIRGKDGVEYIYRNTAYGPFLASRYGNPQVAIPNKEDHSLTMNPFTGKQGIVRLVSYHMHRNKQHPGGHIGLWDCTQFYLSQDWTTEHHLISVEFWETPDSFCPPPVNTTNNSTVDSSKLEHPEAPPIQIVARHNFNYGYFHPQGGSNPPQEGADGHRMRHHRTAPNGNNKQKEVLWAQ